MKHLILLFMAAMLQLSAAQAQNAEGICNRVKKMVHTFSNQAAALEATGFLEHEETDYDIYHSNLGFSQDSTAYVYTLPEETMPIGYDQWITTYTTESEAEKAYNEFFEELKKCFVENFTDQKNPAPKPGEATRMIAIRISPLLVVKLFLMYEHDDMSMHSLSGEDHYVFMSLGMEEEK